MKLHVGQVSVSAAPVGTPTPKTDFLMYCTYGWSQRGTYFRLGSFGDLLMSKPACCPVCWFDGHRQFILCRLRNKNRPWSFIAACRAADESSTYLLQNASRNIFKIFKANPFNQRQKQSKAPPSCNKCIRSRISITKKMKSAWATRTGDWPKY